VIVALLAAVSLNLSHAWIVVPVSVAPSPDRLPPAAFRPDLPLQLHY
jgi:hypothetical protein